MVSGNGVDLAAIYQAVLALDRKLDQSVATLDRKIDAVSNDLSGQIGALREQVTAYHGSVVGHGILITELDERVSHLERGDSPAAA